MSVLASDVIVVVVVAVDLSVNRPLREFTYTFPAVPDDAWFAWLL